MTGGTGGLMAVPEGGLIRQLHQVAATVHALPWVELGSPLGVHSQIPPLHRGGLSGVRPARWSSGSPRSRRSCPPVAFTSPRRAMARASAASRVSTSARRRSALRPRPCRAKGGRPAWWPRGCSSPHLVSRRLWWTQRPPGLCHSVSSSAPEGRDGHVSARRSQWVGPCSYVCSGRGRVHAGGPLSGTPSADSADGSTPLTRAFASSASEWPELKLSTPSSPR